MDDGAGGRAAGGAAGDGALGGEELEFVESGHWGERVRSERREREYDWLDLGIRKARGLYRGNIKAAFFLRP